MGTVFKAQQNKYIEHFDYCIIIAKSLVTFVNKTIFWEIEEEISRLCFSKVNLSSSITPRSLREPETLGQGR